MKIPYGFQRGQIGRKMMARSLQSLIEEFYHLEMDRPKLGEFRCAFDQMNKSITMTFLREVIRHKTAKRYLSWQPKTS
jgi:hypothetical protein